VADYNDQAAFGGTGRLCVRYHEFENVSAHSLAFLAERTIVGRRHGVSIAQDRIAEKNFFHRCSPASKVLPARIA